MNQETLLKTLLDARLRLSAGMWPVLRDTHAIEDIFQVTLLRAVHEAESFQDEEHAIAWARVTARRLAIDHLRKHQVRARVIDESSLDLLDAELDRRGDSALAERLDALKSCVEKLPPRSRRIVDLRYHRRRAGQEIADLLEMTVDAVYQALRRIHLALRDCVERCLENA
ncbi:sigma-70 family RNA polymerase sigma factor [Lignipirellula cremea]|uniref:RNA polymerase sigma factor SigV n=1 Tax=Lignipirellula cremea TaxID=2528010 RepID=A0A518DKS3_9BACT|nr:sigma-70 family RNA polymerase sigma factor [Lignipirellula cremea]QDU92420.1 RNA polymerase sigma factor SigV [Lignipirellula cremea]